MTTLQVRTDENGIVYVRSMLCPALFIEKDGTEFYCERADGHLPSLWHRNREHNAVWYTDRNEEI